LIIYDENHKFSLYEFGIQIPVLNSRATRTFENLKAHPVLGKRFEDWFLAKKDHRLEREDLERAHDRTYVAKLFADGLESEIIKTFELIDAHGQYYRYKPQTATLPLAVLFERILDRVAGTWQCCKAALESGFCFYFGGGMHHAQSDYGNGFCILNDIVIAARKLQAEGDAQKVWVIDVDAHKGDGTAALTADDDSIITLSAHMANGWPLDGSPRDSRGRLNPSFIPSNIDVPVSAGEDRLYVRKLEEGLSKLDVYPRPDIAIVVSGADPYEKDELPSTSDLRLTLEQLFERDKLVYHFLKQRNIPRAYLMAGGYGDSAWQVYTQFLEWVLLDHLGLDRSEPS
jgi:acetoin utilization deacetylase AcuC-like enzyme